ncbi:MAG: hypothetical protein NW224_04165 [Leptolyngbyaceae cyanobacterium bins.302]|nr:hypothetical protein [Leptolyngbyaceae cyanobacterium bins.302]
MVAFKEFQPYLQSVINALQRDTQQGRYVSTLAGLPLRVQTHESSTSKRQEQQEEKREQIAVLEGLRKYAPNHVLLVGKPGSGKTTSLRKLLWEEAERCIQVIVQAEIEIPQIPVLIELRNLRSSVLGAIQEKLSWWLNLDDQRLKSFLRDQRFLILLDGLNELPSDQAWKEVDQFRQLCTELNIPLIITTRELGSGLFDGGITKLEMLPLTETQMREFVCKHLPETGGELLRQIQGRLQELAETPLLLQILCEVFADKGEIPENRGDLFRKEFARRYENFKPERSRNVSEDSRRSKFDLLCRLAFAMIQGEPHTDPCKPTASWITISRDKAARILASCLAGNQIAKLEEITKAKEWLEDLVEWDLLQVASDPNYIEFHHQLFQEYYAAEYLLHDLTNINDKEFKFCYLNYLKWTEVIMLMLSLIDERDFGGNGEEQVVRVMKLALGIDLLPTIDLILGATLAGASRQNFHEKTVGLINALELKIFVGEEIQDSNQFFCIVDGRISPQPSLLEIASRISPHFKAFYEEGWLKHNLPYLNQGLRIRLLNQTSSNAIVPYLLRIISTEDMETVAGMDICDNAIKQLAVIRTRESNEAILQIFNNSDSHYKFVITKELAKANNPQNDLILEKLLSIEKLSGEDNVAKGIRKAIQDKQILQSYPFEQEWYRRYLEFDEIRNAKANALFWNLYMLWILGDRWSLSVLTKLLNDNDLDRYHSNFMMQFSFRFSQMNENNFHKYYLKAMEEADTKAFIYYFGLKSEENERATSTLIKWLRNDLFVDYQSDIVRALSNAKPNSDLFDILFDVLEENEDSDGVRMQAISTLKKIGTPECLSRLLDYLFSSKLAEMPETYEIDEVLGAIAAIQSRCGFYNYEIAQQVEVKGKEPDGFSKKDEYERILAILQNMALVIERNPGTFHSIGEEALRDHFLVQLNGIYEGQATGETFNRRGKTDIIVRLRGENIFIGECKFWGGEIKLLETLDQLLSYSTVRDDQLGMLIFNRNKNIAAVLRQIPSIIKGHSSFHQELDHSETQFRFTLKHPDEPKYSLYLAVLVFDVPSIS